MKKTSNEYKEAFENIIQSESNEEMNLLDDLIEKLKLSEMFSKNKKLIKDT